MTARTTVKIYDYSSDTFVELHKCYDLEGLHLETAASVPCGEQGGGRGVPIDLHSPLSVNRRQAESGPDPLWPELFNPFHFWRRLLPCNLTRLHDAALHSAELALKQIPANSRLGPISLTRALVSAGIVFVVQNSNAAKLLQPRRNPKPPE
jgi:hypothetical protein